MNCSRDTCEEEPVAFPARFLLQAPDTWTRPTTSAWVTKPPPRWVPLEPPMCSLSFSPQTILFTFLPWDGHCAVNVCEYFLIFISYLLAKPCYPHFTDRETEAQRGKDIQLIRNRMGIPSWRYLHSLHYPVLSKKNGGGLGIVKG